MDGREAMSSPYYGFSGLPQIRNPNPHPNPNTSSNFGSGPFQLDSMTSSMSMPMPVQAHVTNADAGGSGSGLGEQAKRKRGRPRKYGPDGGVALALSPGPSSGGAAAVVLGSGGLKRGRGRPPGTGRKQQLASLGEWLSGSAGMGFTPHVITVEAGEDIATKIVSFSQQGPRAVSILSAYGVVSRVTLCQPAPSGGTVTYEGRFEIICMSGSYLLTEDGGSQNRSGGLTISLAYPDHRVIGGGVGGLLIAASPVYVVVGSFLFGSSKAKNKAKPDQDSGPDPDQDQDQDHELQMDDMGTPPAMGGWPGARHMNFDLTRG